MSCEVAVLPFQANANYEAMLIDFVESDLYFCHNSYQSDNYRKSNTEKKQRTATKKEAKKIKSKK